MSQCVSCVSLCSCPRDCSFCLRGLRIHPLILHTPASWPIIHGHRLPYSPAAVVMAVEGPQYVWSCAQAGVRVCVCACVRVCVYACACVWEFRRRLSTAGPSRKSARACVRACVRVRVFQIVVFLSVFLSVCLSAVTERATKRDREIGRKSAKERQIDRGREREKEREVDRGCKAGE